MNIPQKTVLLTFGFISVVLAVVPKPAFAQTDENSSLRR
jgi:hypothetical protein